MFNIKACFRVMLVQIKSNFGCENGQGTALVIEYAFFKHLRESNDCSSKQRVMPLDLDRKLANGKQSWMDRSW
jgi:hypothetical protein